MQCYSWMKSSIGNLLIMGDGETVSGLYIVSEGSFQSFKTQRFSDFDILLSKYNTGLSSKGIKEKAEAFLLVKKELEAYFRGSLNMFSIPVLLKGTEFQLKVWRILNEIPYGSWMSYGDVAKKIGKPKAVRAVGGAVGKNPISIIIPCHRVLGAQNELVGFGSGLDKKEWLLRHEGLEIEYRKEQKKRKVHRKKV